VRCNTAAGTLGVLAALALGACANEADDRPESAEAATGEPVVMENHWHAAFSVYVCDEFRPDIAEFESPEGIHTHSDGVIHIHPFTEAGAGDNATLGLFLRGADIELDDGELAVDGETYRDGHDCDGEPARVQVARWGDVRSGGDPEIVTEDAADLRFEADGEAYTIAVVPEGTDVPPPPSADDLDELGAPDGPAEPDPGAGPGPDGASDGPGDPTGEPPAAGAGADDTPGFRPVLVPSVPAEPGRPCPAGLLGGLDGSCYDLGSDGALGTDVVAAASVETQQGQLTVALEMTSEGIDRFNTLAALCFQQVDPCPTGQLAIVAAGHVVAAPTVYEPAFEADQIMINGNFDADEAEAIAEAITG
jgi:hypothetical protein